LGRVAEKCFLCNTKNISVTCSTVTATYNENFTLKIWP